MAAYDPETTRPDEHDQRSDPPGAAAASRTRQMFENPVTGERAVILTDPRTDPARRLVARCIWRSPAVPTAT